MQRGQVLISKLLMTRIYYKAHKIIQVYYIFTPLTEQAKIGTRYIDAFFRTTPRLLVVLAGVGEFTLLTPASCDVHVAHVS